jgi:hypothetical protein
MTDSERIKNLEMAVARLCDVISRIDRNAMGFGVIAPNRTDLELIKQYVRGDLNGRAVTPDIRTGE